MKMSLQQSRHKMTRGCKSGKGGPWEKLQGKKLAELVEYHITDGEKRVVKVWEQSGNGKKVNMKWMSCKNRLSFTLYIYPIFIFSDEFSICQS